MVSYAQLGFLIRIIKNKKNGFKIKLFSNSLSENSEKNVITEYMSNKNILVIFILILVIRFLLVFIPPQFTTDLARSIFYGQQFWKHGFDVYSLTPQQLDPNFNIIDPTTHQLAWPNNKYDYGIISLLYYAIIGLFPFNSSILIIIAKVIFNLVDIVSFILLILIYPKNREVPILFWILMIPFSSIEGQALSITILFFASSLYFYTKDQKSLAYSILALGFHWKYVTLFILPYFVLNDLYIYYTAEKQNKPTPSSVLKPLFYFSFILIALMFPILFSPYILSYISFEGNLPVQSKPWNPFYIGEPLTIASFLLLFFVISILISWYQLDQGLQERFFKGVGFIPLLGVFGFLLIYKYAFPWYWLWSFPFYSILPVKTRKIFFIFLSICILAAVEFINWTVGFPFITQYLFSFKT